MSDLSWHAMSQEISSTDNMAALERFVIDNDELLDLEERIGRFNIFDALRIARAEIRHSNFLAWLLDPAESHGQGDLFLKAVLMDLLRQAPPGMRPLSPVELDGEELQGVEIRREWKHIDLLIACKRPAFVVAIENKIGSSEGDGQLGRYKKAIYSHFAGLRPLFVLLTADGSDASDDEWMPYGYADIHEVLRRVQRTSRGAVGDDVAAFLEHYLQLIGSRFMDDPKLDELCQRIYRNHRQALELIYERAGSPAAGVLGEIEEAVSKHSGDWHVFNKTSQRVEFIPRAWLDLLPPIGARKTFDPRLWIMLRFAVQKKRCTFWRIVCPTSDAQLREQTIVRLAAKPDEFGFRLPSKTPGSKWTRLGVDKIASWGEDDAPDAEEIVIAVQKKLDQLEKCLAGVPEALRPILAKHR